MSFWDDPAHRAPRRGGMQVGDVAEGTITGMECKLSMYGDGTEFKLVITIDGTRTIWGPPSLWALFEDMRIEVGTPIRITRLDMAKWTVDRMAPRTTEVQVLKHSAPVAGPAW